MKKILTLHNVIKCCAILLGLVAFFLMFANQLYYEFLGNKSPISSSHSLFGDSSLKGAVLSFIGYLFILIAVAGLAVSMFATFDEKIMKIFPLVVAGLFLLGGLFVLLEAALYNGANNMTSIHNTAAPVFAGIFALLSGCGVCATLFVKDKNLGK